MSHVECKVIVKDEDKKLTKDFSTYEAFQMTPENVEVRKMIDSTLSEFRLNESGEPPSIVLKTTMVIQ